jgi:hypothetical protein
MHKNNCQLVGPTYVTSMWGIQHRRQRRLRLRLGIAGHCCSTGCQPSTGSAQVQCAMCSISALTASNCKGRVHACLAMVYQHTTWPALRMMCRDASQTIPTGSAQQNAMLHSHCCCMGATRQPAAAAGLVGTCSVLLPCLRLLAPCLAHQAAAVPKVEVCRAPIHPSRIPR